MKKYVFVLGLCICCFTVANAQSQPTVSEKVVINNAKMKVTEYNSKPGEGVCGKGVHSHPAHLTVLLTEADVKLTLPNGKVMNQKAPAGTTFWSEAETHTVLNNGKTPVRAYIIETKH